MLCRNNYPWCVTCLICLVQCSVEILNLYELPCCPVWNTPEAVLGFMFDVGKVSESLGGVLQGNFYCSKIFF